MGRVKRKIKRLENTNCRLATYAKRKNGIMKKAIGLSILCDVDIILIMFSPSGKPSLCRRKLSIHIHELIFDLCDQARLLQTHINEIHKRLSYWTDLGKSNSENIQKQQFASLQCNNPCLKIRDTDIEGSTSYSFGSHANYLGSSNKTDISISKQENGVLGDMRSTSPMRLQFSYLPNNFNLLNDMDVQSMTLNQGLISTSGPCVVTMFDEHLYTQPSFPPMHIGFT
ncbi:Agamous-like MADS-box protein AGL30 [Glycine soja]|uniref:Agamous-like MADS-box protein AGL30 n=1 Tax=Glycine soja TaxID=3848 RepID=A0A445LMJ0_GLYSO|nr:Agamous-like MADS-box protein AGL30 [Glycine soja]